MGERILELIEALGISQNKFARILNTSSSRISNIARGRNNPDSQILADIIQNFTNVNARWLLTGDGEMFNKKQTTEGSEKNEVKDEVKSEVIPTDKKKSTFFEPKNTYDRKSDTTHNILEDEMPYDPDDPSAKLAHMEVLLNSLLSQFQLLSKSVDDLRMLVYMQTKQSQSEGSGSDEDLYQKAG